MLNGYDTRSRDLTWLHHSLAEERRETGLSFNPLADSFQRRPEQVYADLRERSPVHYSRLLDCWVLTRHREVDRVLCAHDVFRSDPRSTTQELVDPFVMLDPDRPSLFMLDPPDHTRLRAVVQDAFSRAAVERLMPRLAGRVDEVVARLGCPGDRVDLVPRFAAVVPLRLLDLFIGLDIQDADVDAVTGQVSTVVRSLEPIASTRTADESLSAYRALGDYLDERRSRPAPTGTVRSSLDAAVDAGALTDAESRQLLMFLVLSGTATVSDFLAGAARWLTAQPAEAPERQRVDSTLVDDLLVRTSPVQIVARTAATATTLAGHRIQAGQRLLLVLASANRDVPATPGDLSAEAGRPRGDVTFGRGAHRCLGSHLARVQARLALSRLLTAFPAIRLTEAVRARRCVTLRSWDTVVVRL